MKRIISHRANLNGSNNDVENTKLQIEKVINKFNVDVEIDLWCFDDMLVLGHDNPQHVIDVIFLETYKEYLWIHCKNFQAVKYMYTKDYNWFWHQNDSMTLTSKGHVWCYPGVYIDNSITVVFNDKCPISIPQHISGICTDYPLNYL